MPATLPQPSPRRRPSPALLWLFLMLLGFGARAQEVQLSETDLKAAFLFQFAKFVDWPDDAFAGEDSPIEIGILGADDFAAALQSLLQGKKAHGRSFLVAPVSTQSQARKCHMLFFRESETRKLGPMLDGLRHLPILTVGESADFIAQGGMMNFFIDDKQLRFEIGPGPVQAARLTVSSQLMRLAKVRKGGAK